MTDLFHKILIHLYETNSLHQDKDITPFLITYLGDNNHNQSELQNIARTLHRLISFNFIKHFSVPVLGQLANGSPTNYLEEHIIRVNLELLGYNYISDKISQDKQEKLLERQTAINEQSGQSVINTNNLTGKIAKKNLYIALITLAFVAVSTYATYQTYRLSDASNQREQLKQTQNTQLELLYKQASKKSDSLVLLKKKIDSLSGVLTDKKR
jgi:hypothetical protein